MSALSAKQPYPGLRPFEEADQAYFFGRDTQIQGLRQKLDGNRLVAVVGRSGCGKSSLVKAGLIPLLAKEAGVDAKPAWRIASLRPQGRPIEELGKALVKLAPGVSDDTKELRRSRVVAMLSRSSRGLVEAASELAIPASSSLLIIIDQFEEIFRFEDARGSDADEATAFVRLLMEAINSETPEIRVLLTMRLDFLGDCARFQRLPEAISDGQFLVPNLGRAERRAAIEEPARACKKVIRPEVTQLLLNEIGEDPDQLPVLQHVLMRMWQQAGDSTEITLKTYAATGGVKNAISLHADQIYNALPPDAHRLAARRLFKAISERDRRGRSIRRATAFDDIAKIVAGDDDTNAASVQASTRLETVINAFRAPDCCFLMPAADTKLLPTTPIDISHESLLRSWSKMTGTTGNDGWIAEEDRDGRIYRGLLEAAENGSRLSSKVARERQQWWHYVRPSPAWAERYGNNFAAVSKFVRDNAIRARFQRIAIPLVILLAVGSLLSFAAYQSYEAVQRDSLSEALRIANRQNREKVNELNLAQAKIIAQQEQLDQRNRELGQTIRQAKSALPLNDEKARQDLDSLLRASGSALDNTVQRPIVNAADSSSLGTLSSRTGFMWIGSTQNSNVKTLAGAPVATAGIKNNEQYLVGLDIYLRQGLPDRSTYTQTATLGIMPQGTRVTVLGVAPPFSRPSGEQYWAQVNVVSLALSTVYFQFAGSGSREQAQQISKALQEKGYRISGEERLGSAAGKREVRYFYPGQKDIAQQLATDATQVLQQLGYPRPTVTIEQGGDVTKSNTDGKLELWIEIPSK